MPHFPLLASLPRRLLQSRPSVHRRHSAEPGIHGQRLRLSHHRRGKTQLQWEFITRIMRPRCQRFKTRTRHTSLSRHCLDSPKAAETTTLPICTSHDLRNLVACPPPDLQPFAFAVAGLWREFFSFCLFVCLLFGQLRTRSYPPGIMDHDGLVMYYDSNKASVEVFINDQTIIATRRDCE